MSEGLFAEWSALTKGAAMLIAFQAAGRVLKQVANVSDQLPLVDLPDWQRITALQTLLFLQGQTWTGNAPGWKLNGLEV